MNFAKQDEKLLRKLNQVFKDGYRPMRGNQSYGVKLKNRLYAYENVNCFGHACFNLRNEQLNDYKFKPYRVYDRFMTEVPSYVNLSSYFPQKTKESIFNYIKETGLIIEECNPKEIITDFKSWKVALYFLNNDFHRDFHFLLEESPSNWSSKLGYENYLEHINQQIPPDKYSNSVEQYPGIYEFYGTYKITNKNADENNRYVKGRIM